MRVGRREDVEKINVWLGQTGEYIDSNTEIWRQRRKKTQQQLTNAHQEDFLFQQNSFSSACESPQQIL